MNRGLPFFFVAAGLVLMLLALPSMFAPAGKEVSWSELKGLVGEDNIEEVRIHSDYVVAQKKDVPEGEPRTVRAARVTDDAQFVPMLEERGVKYAAVPENGCGESAIMVAMLPMFALLMLWVLFLRQDGNRDASQAAFGRSTANFAPEEGTGVQFDDVAGVDEAVEELQEVVAFLKTPEKFTRLGGRPPKGVLLVGPPGTGKTLLARAVAGEAGVPFLSISGSSFVEMFVGVGAARVRDLFKTASENAPCIIFIDELDAVGRARGMGGPGSNEEREQTLNQMLVEMDGFDNRSGVIVMAATNRPEVLDPALLRAGRFDRQVLVDRPDLIGRHDILKVHAKEMKLGDEVNLEEVAKMTPGFAGADLANALNEAALLAARRGNDAVLMKDIDDAIERIMAGLEKKTRRLDENTKRTVAYHECGHAICAAACPGADPVKKISIIPRGVAALGYTLQTPTEDRYLRSKAELLNELTILYGGRAAEEIVFGDVTTGAHNDIQRATDIARRMVVEYGMSRSVGALNYGPSGQQGFLGGERSWLGNVSPETAETIEKEVRSLTDLCYNRAVEILLANRILLEEMSLALLKTEVLAGDEMRTFLDRTLQAASLEEPPTGELVDLHRGE